MTVNKLQIVVDAVWKGSSALDKAGRDLKKAQEQTKKNTEGLQHLASQAAAMGAGVAAAGVVFKKAFDLSREGASLNQLTQSFDRMNESVYKTPDLLNQMSNAVNGTIAKTDLMAGLLTLTAGASDEMSQQLAAASPRLLEIAKASNALNPALGDTAFLYDSIAKGIKRGSPLILDNLGIIINQTEANKKWAAANGVAVASMTKEQQTLAILNATLESGGKLIEQVGGDVTSQADAWAKLTIQTQEAANAAKQFLAVRLSGVVGGTADTIDAMTEASERGRTGWQNMAIVAAELNKAIFGVQGVFGLWADDIRENEAILAAYNEELENANLGYRRQTMMAESAAIAVTELGNASGESSVGIQTNAQMLAYMALVAKDAGDAASRLEEGLASVGSDIEPVSAYTQELIDQKAALDALIDTQGRTVTESTDAAYTAAVTAFQNNEALVDSGARVLEEKLTGVYSGFQDTGTAASDSETAVGNYIAKLGEVPEEVNTTLTLRVRQIGGSGNIGEAGTFATGSSGTQTPYGYTGNTVVNRRNEELPWTKPNQPTFASGTNGWQTVPGPMGAPYPVTLHGGERFNVTPTSGGSGQGAMSQNNVFHITGSNPMEIANQVSVILAKQARMQGAAGI